MFAGTAQAAAVHYEIAIGIYGNELRGHAVITAPPGRDPDIMLSAPFVVDALKKEETRVDVRWHGPVAADPRGLFLPASSGWYPAIEGELASYSVLLELAGGQVGLVPGALVEESSTPQRYRARFEFPHPSPGIDLMAGPYRISEREARSAAGRPIRLRTYFHPEIAALAPAYLDSLGGYLELYGKSIGEYPFGEFSVVSSPTPTGYGMATLTYLGVEVLKLPFIRATSLGHEVLHNWWGNGVYPDYARGNWSEGLTTFMADYAYKEREGAGAAREMRLAWLRDLAALPASEDFPLRAFVSRTHSASQIVGYRKSAMLFLMLRDALGAESFAAALRAFWREQRFKVAGWSELQRAFELASGRSLEKFFSQWIERSGLPQVRIADAQAVRSADGWRVEVTLLQDSVQPYELQVPLELRTELGAEPHVVTLDSKAKGFQLEARGQPRELLLDPEARVLRKLSPSEAPPILRRVAVDPELRTVLLTNSVELSSRKLAEAIADHPLQLLPPTEIPGDAPLLVIGLHAEVDAWLARHALAPRPPTLAGKGSAQAWTATRAAGEPIAVVSARDAASLDALARPLPHYGAQSFVVFEGATALERGVWPSQPQAWKF